jgi:hypothetical protein
MCRLKDHSNRAVTHHDQLFDTNLLRLAIPHREGWLLGPAQLGVLYVCHLRFLSSSILLTGSLITDGASVFSCISRWMR